MAKKNTKKNRQNREARYLIKVFSIFAVSFMIYLGLSVIFESRLSSLNIQTQEMNDKISLANAKIDGLNTEKQEKISFENIVKVANKKGYTLNYSSDKVTAEANSN